MLDTCGIYMIRCRVTGDYYIGSTARTFRQRFVEHQTQLRCGRCSVPKLQDAVTRYGLEEFDFVPLRTFPPEELVAREKEAIATLRPSLNTDLGVPGSREAYDRMPEVTIGGETMTMKQAARRFGVGYQTLRTRYARGLRGDDLVAAPHKAPRKQNRGWYTKNL